MGRRERLRAARELFWQQGGVASRRQLYAIELKRWELRAELRAHRWVRAGRQTICGHTGELSELARWWAATFEVGSQAALDGVTALQAAGLRGYDDDLIHVSMPKSGRPRRCRGVRVHETRRRAAGDLVDTGVPRVRPPVAAVRAALWARSDRQSALVLTMAVQQGLTTANAIAEALSTVRRHRRRRLLAAVLADLLDGVRSLGELDFARLCREYGLPCPDRQVVRAAAGRTAYLDVAWSDYGVAVEIDGIHHAEPGQVLADARRQNDIVRGDMVVLRVPVLGLRTEHDSFMTQIRATLLSRGWSPSVTSEAVV